MSRYKGQFFPRGKNGLIKFFGGGNSGPLHRCRVDIHYGARPLQDVDASPDVFDNGPVACVLPIKGENTNCRLAIAEYIKDTFRVA